MVVHSDSEDSGRLGVYVGNQMVAVQSVYSVVSTVRSVLVFVTREYARRHCSPFFLHMCVEGVVMPLELLASSR